MSQATTPDARTAAQTLSFVVLDGLGVYDAPEAVAAHAYLVGPEDVPAPGDIRFSRGMIRCEKVSRENVGLALPVRVERSGGGDLGSVILRTCLLPPRDEPYLLSLELARSRIMAYLNKLEDWSLLDLADSHPAMALFQQAREAFTAALIGQRDGAAGYSAEADRLARAALALAVEAGERLAFTHAERELEARAAGHLYKDALRRAEAAASLDVVTPDSPARNPQGLGVVVPGTAKVGCAVNPAQMSGELKAAIVASCDFISLPMRWRDMEPVEGTYAFEKTDAWIEWAVRAARLPVVAGPIVDLREAAVPDWLLIWENDYETLRELVYEHVRQIVTRYRRTVSRWTVCSGVTTNSGFSLAFEQMLDLTRICVLVVRRLHPQARVQLEISQPWGEYVRGSRGAMAPMLYAEALGQIGVQVDAIGLKLVAGAPGRYARDPMVISDILDRYARLERPITITALSAPSTPPAEAAGHWREPWSPDRQAEWLARTVALCAGKPYVHSVCWGELADGPDPLELPTGGLLGEGGPKPALDQLTAARRAARKGEFHRP